MPCLPIPAGRKTCILTPRPHEQSSCIQFSVWIECECIHLPLDAVSEGVPYVAIPVGDVPRRDAAHRIKGAADVKMTILIHCRVEYGGCFALQLIGDSSPVRPIPIENGLASFTMDTTGIQVPGLVQCQVSNIHTGV